MSLPFCNRLRQSSRTWSRAGCAFQMAFTVLALPFHFIRSSNAVVKNTASHGDTLVRVGQRRSQPDQDETLGCSYSELICRNAHASNSCPFVWNRQLLAHHSSLAIWILLVLLLSRSSRKRVIAPVQTLPSDCATEWNLDDKVHKDMNEWEPTQTSCTRIHTRITILSLLLCHFRHKRTLTVVVYILRDLSHTSLSLSVVFPIFHLYTFFYYWRVKIQKTSNSVKHVK